MDAGASLLGPLWPSQVVHPLPPELPFPAPVFSSDFLDAKYWGAETFSAENHDKSWESTVLRSSSSLAQALHAAAVTSVCEVTFSLPHKHGYLPATHINKWLLVPQSSALCVVSLGVGPKWRTHVSLLRWNYNMKLSHRCGTLENFFFSSRRLLE